ncbi:hypothetical protein ERICII_01663 [Paenibacillus larvae subsp. larvae DSM 25430]|nr:hypothetical protein [Paenibacillus larvae]AVG12061.1 hypothetical protein ERICII_01663 [Paenibacillus larvae subsp. larvae DSM 25430]MDR5569953.1 hypothetical protein [Paenibacillus larvae]
MRDLINKWSILKGTVYGHACGTLFDACHCQKKIEQYVNNC